MKCKQFVNRHCNLNLSMFQPMYFKAANSLASNFDKCEQTLDTSREVPWQCRGLRAKNGLWGLGKTLANFAGYVIYFLCGTSYFFASIYLSTYDGRTLPRKYITQQQRQRPGKVSAFTAKVAFEDIAGWTPRNEDCAVVWANVVVRIRRKLDLSPTWINFSYFSTTCWDLGKPWTAGCEWKQRKKKAICSKKTFSWSVICEGVQYEI